MNNKSEIARKYRSEYPDMPTLALARIVKKENEVVFKDVEDARSTLRYIEGKQGEKHRKKVVNTEYYKKETRPMNPYPKSLAKDFKPFIIKGSKKIGIISDLHIPYHDEDAVYEAINKLKEFGIDLLLLNGDIIDFYQLSNFIKDQTKKGISYEINMLKKFLDLFEKELKCKIIYKLGNHEERYDRFLMQRAPELLEMKDYTIEKALGCTERNIEVVKEKRTIKVSQLNIIHGHELGLLSTAVNPARALFLKAKTNVIEGHYHRTSEHNGKDLEGKIKVAWSMGCLCHLNPEYRPHNEWEHGYALVEIEDEKNFKVHNKRIYKGKTR